MNKVIKIFMITIIFLSTVFSSHALEKNHWIIGIWELSYDPDGNSKDWIEFTKEGHVYSINSDKTIRVPGTYKVSESKILVLFSWKGNNIPMEYTYKDSKEVLYVYSEKTSNTSKYVKLK